jgi:TonB family protein
MHSMAQNPDQWFADIAKSPMPASLAVSVLIHLLLVVCIALIIRAMPAVVAPQNNTPPSLAATLAAVPAAQPVLEMLQELPPPSPFQPMDSPPQTADSSPVSSAAATPLLHTPLAGISVNPATAVIEEEFAPVGHINNSTGNGRDDFGPRLPDQMQERFPEAASVTPTPIGSLSALYPTKAARQGRSMKLSALLMIDAAGNITEARVLPNDPSFAAAIIAALKGARFKPAERAGKPVPYWTVLEFRFKIDGPTGPDGKRLDQ